MFEESTSLLVAAGPESTSRLRSTTQLRRGVEEKLWVIISSNNRPTAGEWHSQGGQLIEDASQRPDVRFFIVGFSVMDLQINQQ